MSTLVEHLPLKPYFTAPPQTTKPSKLYKQGQDFIYQYGAEVDYQTKKPPELKLTLTATEVTKTPWPGVSRTIWQSLGFQNKDYTYEVYSSVERMATDSTECFKPDKSAGIHIAKEQKHIKSIACDMDAPVIDYLDIYAQPPLKTQPEKTKPEK